MPYHTDEAVERRPATAPLRNRIHVHRVATKPGGSDWADIAVSNEHGEETTIANGVPWPMAHALCEALDGVFQALQAVQAHPDVVAREAKR